MTPPKRKRLEKSIDAPEVVQRYQCYRCGRLYVKLEKSFPTSHSPVYRGVGHLPFCHTCVDEMYTDYLNKYGSPKEAVRRLCMKLDLYWNDSLFDIAMRASSTRSVMRSYISKTNLLRYIDKNFDDTLDEAPPDSGTLSSAAPVEEAPIVLEADFETPSEEVISFWGEGYTPSFYAELERRYKDWTNNLKSIAPNERALYKQICLLETIIARDGAAGRPVDKNINMLNTLLGSMNLKPTQQKDDADQDLERMPLGVGIQKWEHYRPLPETPPSMRDIRGTIKNITTWYLGHAAKMVGLKNSYCKMYEDAMEELRVKHPECADEDDDTLLNDIFAGKSKADDKI